ncbi:MAG TPA: AAC(3) family N-acetyltransferase [Anaerolineales bacterium]|nr:AAC(3) family N-acetyltransferase [Anaerolineales bacterium]
MLQFAELRSAFKELELADKPVIVHSSLKRFGPIECGPKTVIQALLATTNGLIVPTFTYLTMITPEVGPPNNGITYGRDRDLNRMAVPFHLGLQPDKMMGSVPRTLLLQEGSIRTAHPILSFGGIGVDHILITQTLHQPLAPIGALADHDGWVILINVDHSVNTSIHYAEKLASRRQFLRWALLGDRIVKCPGFPGDSSGFNAIEEHVRADTRFVQVNNAIIQAVPLKKLFAAVQELIKKDPLALLCQRSDCERCNAVRNA